MKVTLLNDTSGHANWGCVATSAGLKALIHANWPKADTKAYPAELLPYPNRPLRRRRLNRKITKAILTPDRPDDLASALETFRFDFGWLTNADYVIVNGEGMIHAKSGHLIRLLGILEYARRQGHKTAIVNQTVDLDPESDKAALLAQVYTHLDAVLVRDNDSLALLQGLGIDKARLVPDAAFATSAPNVQEIEAVRAKLGLPRRFVAITGSSALSKTDGSKFAEICDKVAATFRLPLVILASTKTDLRLAQSLPTAETGPTIIDASTGYRDVVAVIAAAQALVGGRFHPMIFACLAATPLLGLAGNTHKIGGLLKYLDYPISEVVWGDSSAIDQALSRLSDEQATLSNALQTRAAALTSTFNGTTIFDESVEALGSQHPDHI